jgi:hypothetical protein
MEVTNTGVSGARKKISVVILFSIIACILFISMASSSACAQSNGQVFTLVANPANSGVAGKDPVFDSAYLSVFPSTPVTVSITDRTVLAFGESSFTSSRGPGSTQLNIRGTYDPTSGNISGAYYYEIVWHNPSGSSGPTQETICYVGRLTGKILPTDKHGSLGGPGMVTTIYDPDKEGLKTWSVTNPAAPYWMYDVEQPEASPTPMLKPYEPEVDQGMDSGCRFSDLAGQVEVNEPSPDGTYNDENWHYAKLNEVIRVGAHIRTSEKSGAILSFADMGTFNMKPETEIIITTPVAHDSQIQLLWGNLKVNVQKMMKDGSMTVEMSQAVCGIKGTTFIVNEDLLSSNLQVIEGTVAYNLTNGTSYTVKGGEQMTASYDGAVVKKAFDASKAPSFDLPGAATSSAQPTAGDQPTKTSDFLSPVAVVALIAIVAIVLGRRR